MHRLSMFRSPVLGAIRIAGITLAFSGLSLSCCAQTTHASKAKAVAVEEKSTVEPGVAVEVVDAGSEGDKAGLRVGDVILGWSRGDVTGRIESPFDYIWVDIEQRPRGEVTLDGMRGQLKWSWTVRRGVWGLTMRPNFTGKLLRTYREGWAMAIAGHGGDGARLWDKQNATLPREVPWISAWSIFNQAKLYRWGNEVALSDAKYRLAVALSQDLGAAVQSRIINSWGGLFCYNGRLAKATDHFLHSAALLPQSEKGSLVEAYYLADLASALARDEKIEAAKLLYSDTLAIRERAAPDSLDLADTLQSIGLLYLNEDNFSEGSASLQKALEIQHRLAPGSFEEALSLSNLGWIANASGELGKAEDYYKRALDILTKVAPKSTTIAGVLNGLGNVATRRGDLAGASILTRKAIRILQSTPESEIDLASDIAMLASIEFDKGNVRIAWLLLQKADQSFRRVVASNPNYLIASGNLGDAARHIGKSRVAERYLTKSLKIVEDRGLRGYIKCWALTQLANLYVDRGDFLKAEPKFLEALSLSQSIFPGSTDQAEILAGLARVALLKRRPESAMKYYFDSLEALETQTLHLGGASQARTAYRANHLDYYRAYIDLLVQQEKPEQAFRILERSRARTLLETLSAATVDIRQGADPELLKREHTLQAVIKAKSAHRIHMLTQEHTAEQVKAIETELADLTRQYDEVEENLRSTSPNYSALTQPKPLTTEEIQNQLLDKDTVLVEYSLGEKRSYAFVVTPDSLTAHELPSQLKIEREARRLHRLLKNEGNSSSSLTVPSKPNTVSKAAQALAVQRETHRTAALLSRMVLDPIADEIGNKRLLIVADGALHYIPFTALPEPAPHAAKQARGSQPASPLMVNHEVILLPSASVLAVLRKQQERKPAPTAEVAVLADPVFDKADARVHEAQLASRRNAERPMLAAANPIAASNKTAPTPTESAKSMYDLSTPPLTRSLVDVGLGRGAGSHLPRLRYTRREAEAIYAEVPQGSAMKALDFDANRATATSADLSHYRIVHFATHGLLNSEHPELSGLVLSLVDRDGKPQDGFLGLQDIYNMNLPADLVVLSACETGLGKEISGEGLIGLTRGFMYAGASRVVASLWKVSDAATANLMAEFYRSMEQDHLAPAAALRQAQIFMWKQKRWSDPYYWAAFQIQGEWK